MSAAHLTRLASLAAAAGVGVALVNRATLLAAHPAPRATAESVAVCVPARDEAGTVGALLADLRAQLGVQAMHVLVLDDDSTDATAAVATQAVAGDPRFQVISADDAPPPGWLGKPSACTRLADLVPGCDVLVFVDADVRLAPTAVAAGVALLRENGLDLVSPWPRQVAVGPLERLVQPLLAWSWFTTLPLPVATGTTHASMAVACGQLLVVDAAAYRRVGGHAVVAADVLDDLGLARALRRAGGRTAPAAGARLASCRMYESPAALRRGYTKSLWAAFGGPVGSTVVLGTLGWVHVWPAAAAVLGSGRTRWWGLLGWAATTTGRLLTASRTGDRAMPDALTHPLAVLALIAMSAASHRGHRRGTLDWKGRPVAP